MKVLVLMPTKDGVSQKGAESLLNQDYEDYSVLVSVMRPKTMHEDKEKDKFLNIAQNRNHLRKLALASDADFFLWVDADVVLPKYAITELLKANQHIVGGWYAEGKGTRYVVGKWIADNVCTSFPRVQKSVVKVDYVGLGCCLMSREVLSKVEFEAGTDKFCKDEFGNEYFLGDCLSFCNKAFELGYNSYADGDVICIHERGEL
jgi:GT2 family glycosyltransferase